MLRLQTFFTLMEKKKKIAEIIMFFKRQKSRLEYAHISMRNKMFTSSECINVSVKYIFNRNTTSVSRTYCRLYSITDFPSGNI